MPTLTIESLSFLDWSPIDLTVAPGETIGLSGPSGSGKSLFVRAIADLDPHRGRVLLDDTESTAIPPHEWRRRVGLLPADPVWWRPTVGEHLLGDCTDFLTALDFEPDVTNWEVSRLSAGERQRLGLVRLLSRNPEVLLLDEPTANLDPANTTRVETLVTQYRHTNKSPILWIAHTQSQLARLTPRQYHFTDKALHPAGNTA